MENVITVKKVQLPKITNQQGNKNNLHNWNLDLLN